MSLEVIRRTPVTSAVILEQLDPAAAAALDAHIEAKEKRIWYPHEIIPDTPMPSFYGPDSPYESATKSGLFVNGETETNLPHYTGVFVETLRRKYEAWRMWTNRWTWEESLHTRGMDRYAAYTGFFDPDWLEGATKTQMTGGDVPHPRNAAEALIYATVQEDLTRIAHMRVGRRVDEVGHRLFGEIAGDEGRHHKFNRDVAKALREQFPNQFAVALLAIIDNFEMPGTGIPGYLGHALVMAQAGIFSESDVANSVNEVVSEHWSFETLGHDVSTDRARRAVDKICALIETNRVLIEGGESKVDRLRFNQVVAWVAGKPQFSRERKQS